VALARRCFAIGRAVVLAHDSCAAKLKADGSTGGKSLSNIAEHGSAGALLCSPAERISAMNDFFLHERDEACRPLWLVSEQEAESYAAERLGPEGPSALAWMRSNGFRGERHRVLAVARPDGSIGGVFAGVGRLANRADLGPAHSAAWPERLPDGRYFLAETLPSSAATQVALGWALGRYRFDRYRQGTRAPGSALVAPAGADLGYVRRAARADAFARDLINTPAADLGPAELAAAGERLAQQSGARCTVLIGDALEAGYPAIHAVGRGAAAAPRLIELRYGELGPCITLVGKGVCFDTGGLDLKPGTSMLLMKKDMGGAAIALALAQMIMDAKLPLRLRVLVPAVENSIGPHSYRPGDILRTRLGLTVEVGNTDAEGRLVLADALAAAGEEETSLLLDFATLTGAARVALGPELPALFANADALQREFLGAAAEAHDPLWPLPLWAGYDDELQSKIADICNVGSSGQAGSIVAALFLRRFVKDTTPWAHLDLYAWNPKERPGRPVGAEAQALRAAYALIAARCLAQQ
jgi:leucyl aminopeptidase